MSDTILRVLAVFEDIKRERAKGDKRSNRQVLTDVLDRIARDRDVRPVVVLDSIVRELNPDVTSVEQLERAIEAWLSGSSDLKRILNKQVRDQIDARAVADFFQDPVAQASAKPSSTEASPVAETPRPTKKAKGAKAKAEAAARALAREAEAAARARAQEAEAAAQAATEARGRALAEAEAAAEAAAEARSRAEAEAEAAAVAAAEARARADAQAEAAAQAAAEARARAEAAEQAEAEARARAESAADESSQAAETEQSLRRVTLDEDVAAFFADEQAVNDFLRAAIAALGRLRPPDDGDDQ